MTGPSSRSAKKKTPQRRRISPRKRSSSSRFLLVLAIPVLALLGFLVYQFLHAPDRQPPAVAVEEVPKVEPLESALRKAGFEKGLMHRTSGKVVLDSFMEPGEVLTRLRRQLPDASLHLSGNEIQIARGGELESVVVHRLQRGDRGDGFEPVPEKGETGTYRPLFGRGDKRIALIIDDVGFDRQPLEAAAALPGALSFAVIPGTPNARESADLLSRRGHEILCHLPMEPNDYPRQSPGAGAIFTSMANDSIRKLASEDLDSIPHARGLNNHMGSRATRDPRVMREVLAVAREKGFYFIDSRTISGSIGESMARSMKVPTAGRDVFLDDIETSAAIRRQLNALAERAESHGLAVGIGHIYPVTMQVLREEIPRLQSKGFRFIPASEAVH